LKKSFTKIWLFENPHGFSGLKKTIFVAQQQKLATQF